MRATDHIEAKSHFRPEIDANSSRHWRSLVSSLTNASRSKLVRRIALPLGGALIALQLGLTTFELVDARRALVSNTYRRADSALDILAAMHTQAMLHRRGIADGDPAISTFNASMAAYSNSGDDVAMWVVMGPKVLAFQSAREAVEAEHPRDAVDQRTIQLGVEQSSEIDGHLRVSRPVILNRAPADASACEACHGQLMGIRGGDVMGAYSVDVDMGPELAAWREKARRSIGEALLTALAGIVILGALLLVTTLSPIIALTVTTRRLSAGDLRQAPSEADRNDEIGEMARALAAFRKVLIRKEALESANAFMARHDGLTQLPNRTGHAEQFERLLAEARREGGKIGVVSIDLNRFKEINDRFGHATGDAVLAECATRMRLTARSGEHLARLGGDEFAAIKHFAELTELESFVARLKAALSGDMSFEGAMISLSASIGVAIFPEDGATSDAVTNNADLALYRSKRRGGAPQFYAPEMDEAVRNQRLLLDDLKEALRKNELIVHYQPQRSIASNAVVGHEALVRWRHPLRGMIPPSTFVPIAEESGLINEIGRWVLERACADAATWPNAERVAVNLSPRQIADVDIVRQVSHALIASSLSPGRLELEITETMIIADKLHALHVLRQLKALGVSIAMDDFGTGYSSLETLNIFPFDKIKIDQSFVADALQRPQARSIIRTILALGRSLEIPILAEGVETREQLELLQMEGCDEAQGYLLGRPTPHPHTQREMQKL